MSRAGVPPSGPPGSRPRRRGFRWPWASAEEIARQVDDEIAFHLDMRARELERQGLAAAAAREQAEREFGDVEGARRSLRAIELSTERHRRRREWLGEARSDLRLAWRSLRRSPGFTFVAVLTLGLGIGGNVALFSVLDAVVLSSLPYPDPDRLVVLWCDLLKRDVREYPASPADLVDYREAPAFAGVAGVTTFDTTLTGTSGGAAGEGPPERLEVGWATTEFFDVLGVPPALGRGFEPADGVPFDPEAEPGAEEPPAVVVLGHELWKRRFGGDPGVVGGLLRLDGHPARVVGVAPPGLQLLASPGSPVSAEVDLWMAARLDATFRGGFFLYAFARLAPGATLADAQGQMDALSARQREQFANYEAAGSQVRVEPLAADLSRGARPKILTLFGAVGFVLLIASVNVANLQLLRASDRRRELSLRAALGADRRRLARELLAECGLVASLGGLLGLGLARLLLDGLRALAPAELPRLDAAAIDRPVLAFALALTLTTALLFGILPSMRAAGTDLMGSLKARTRGGGGAAEGRLRSVLVTVEVGLSLVLLVGAGLMVRSLAALQRLDLGFEPRGVLTFQLPIPGGKYPEPEERSALKERFEEAVAALPGVRAVGASSALPLEGGSSAAPYGPAAALAAGDESDLRQANVRFVRPGYFRAVGTRLLRGRDLTPADDRQALERSSELFGGDPPAAAGPPAPVAPVLVDRELADSAWPGEDPLGKPLYVKVRVPGVWFEVVGVVESQRQAALVGDRPTLYLPEGLVGSPDTLSWAVRAASDPRALVGPIRRAVAALDPEIPLDRVRLMEAYVAEAMAPTRFTLWLIGLFAAVALALATVGLYGVLASSVRQRTTEIGVRLAFGASRRQILSRVLGQGLLLALAGVGLGLLAAAGLTRFLTGMLVEVSPTDPATFGAISLLILGAAAGACALPALRATRVEPVGLLRED